MAALTMKQIAGNTYMIPSPANIGVWVSGSRELIVCTHSNADHVGGNAFLQKRTGCRIAATAVEATFVGHPWLEPSLLYGAWPMKALRNKFLMAMPSTVTDVIQDEGRILDTPLEALPLPGHFLGMIGVRTPDDVLFIADSVFSEAIIAKYPVLFMYDVEKHLETLHRLEGLSAVWYVPSHAAPGQDIGRLVQVNIRRVEETVSLVESLCLKPSSFEDILEGVCSTYGIDLDMSQYVLVGSTVRSTISYLSDHSRIEARFFNGKLTWVRLEC
jgi:glyoxylase-like metal-dependent hydrolase (beta-lactamase superfamily II)